MTLSVIMYEIFMKSFEVTYLG